MTVSELTCLEGVFDQLYESAWQELDRQRQARSGKTAASRVQTETERTADRRMVDDSLREFYEASKETLP